MNRNANSHRVRASVAHAMSAARRLCALVAILFLAHPARADDESDIRAMLADLEAKILAHDVSGVLAHFSEQYFQDGDDFAELSASLTEAVPLVTAFAFQIAVVAVDGDSATVTGTVNATLSEEVSTWEEPSEGDGLGIGWLKREDGIWRVFGNHSRIGSYAVQTGYDPEGGSENLRFYVESPFPIQSATVSGPFIEPTALSPDAVWGGLTALATPSQRPSPGAEYTFSVAYENGGQETVTDTIGAWIDVAPELTTTSANGVTTFSWTDVSASVPNPWKYMLSVQGNGVSWLLPEIPLTQTSVDFNADGAATGTLEPGQNYSVSITIFNQTQDYAYRLYQFTADNDGTPPAYSAIETLYAYKERLYSQIDDTQATTPEKWNFRAGAVGESSLTGANLLHPGVATPVDIAGADGSFNLNATNYASMGELNAAFPNGDITLGVTVDSSDFDFGPFSLTGDLYPPVPRILNWTALKEHDFSQSFELEWSPFANPGSDDRIAILVWDTAANDERVFEFLDAGDESYTFPPDTFQPDSDYDIEVSFLKATDGRIAPDAIIGYLSTTRLDLATSDQGEPDVELVYAIKGRSFEQTDNAAATDAYDWRFAAGASGGSNLNSATVLYPGIADPLAIPGSDGDFETNLQDYATKAELDAAYPNGNVSLGITVNAVPQNLGVFSLVGDAYPEAPHMLNVEELAEHDFSQSFQLSWAAFAGAGAEDRILLSIWNESADNDAVSEFLDGAATSFTIPANALSADGYYQVELTFINQLDGLEDPPTIVGYITTTNFRLAAFSSAFSFWLYQRFDSQQLQNPAITGANADPDGDGQTNYFEFLAQLDPTDRNSRIAFEREEETLRIYPINTETSWNLQTSGNLKAWSPVEPDDYELVGQELRVEIGDFAAPYYIQLVFTE